MSRPRLALAGFLVALIGCASPAPKKAAAPAPVARIHRIAVSAFEGPEGRAVADEFIRQLIVAGFEVDQPSKGVDAVLTGNVTDYRGANKRMVFLGQVIMPGTKDQTMTVTHPIVPASANPLGSPTLAASAGAPMVSVTASIGVVAKLIAKPSGRVLWANGYNYEGLTAAPVRTAVARVLVRSMNDALRNAGRVPDKKK